MHYNTGEYNWDQPISAEDEYKLIEPGEYAFEVVEFTRARYQGGANLPACNEANYTLQIINDMGQNVSKIKHRLFLHERTQGLIVQFFKAIGLHYRDANAQFVPPWDSAVGTTGRCIISTRKYIDKSGGEQETNDITRFIYNVDNVAKNNVTSNKQTKAQAAVQHFMEQQTQPQATQQEFAQRNAQQTQQQPNYGFDPGQEEPF